MRLSRAETCHDPDATPSRCPNSSPHSYMRRPEAGATGRNGPALRRWQADTSSHAYMNGPPLTCDILKNAVLVSNQTDTSENAYLPRRMLSLTYAGEA
jgi:hypothetical protein